MSAINLNIPHNLTQDEALTRIKGLLAKLKEDQKDTISDAKEDWLGNKGSFSFKAKGFNIAGDIEVSDSNVKINSQLPLAVSFFKGPISDIITKKATELLQ